MTASAEVVIDTTTVTAHLRDRGLLRDGSHPEVGELAGGVSGVVLAVDDGDRRLVVKQALAKLRTEREWRSDPRRILVEAVAMRLCHTMTPAYVPEVLDVDDDRLVVVMTGAPPDWQDWKQQILDGAATRDGLLDTAAHLGRVLGTWHTRTRLATGDVPADLAGFTERQVFDELRIDPFHRAVLREHPDLKVAVGTCIDDLLGDPVCLVHGDFSPKNVLVGGDRPWVLDFEVAHLGHPVFDLAFCSSHLALKGVHLPDRAGDLYEAWSRYVHAYADVAGPLPDRFGWHTACLMLARVDGVSPATYLTEPDKHAVRDLTRDILTAEPAEITALWERIVAMAADRTEDTTEDVR